MEQFAIITYEHSIYELTHELTKLGNMRKVAKSHRIKNFVNTSKKALGKQKLYFSCSALFHTKTRVSPKYPRMIVAPHMGRPTRAAPHQKPLEFFTTTSLQHTCKQQPLQFVKYVEVCMTSPDYYKTSFSFHGVLMLAWNLWHIRASRKCHHWKYNKPKTQRSISHFSMVTHNI